MFAFGLVSPPFTCEAILAGARESVKHISFLCFQLVEHCMNVLYEPPDFTLHYCTLELNALTSLKFIAATGLSAIFSSPISVVSFTSCSEKLLYQHRIL